MNILSWNVNGIRAIHRKDIYLKVFENGFTDVGSLGNKKFDVIGLQETKAEYTALDKTFFPEDYKIYHNSAAERKGYSGTVVYVSNLIESKQLDIDVTYETLRTEGRVVMVEIADYIFINCYFPNGGGKPERLVYKLRFYDQFTAMCLELEKKHKKKVIFFGDLNIAHKEIDLARPKQNENHVGFLPEERVKLDTLNNKGFFDMYRHLNPDTIAYTWWDMKTRSRERDIGWRIDSFYCSEECLIRPFTVHILKDTLGSDHCPVILSLE